MKIERCEKEKTTILLPSGDLVFEGIDELENQLKASCDDACRVILNLTNTRYLSARVLGVIGFYVKNLRDRQKALKIVTASENIKKLFAVTGLYKLIEIYESEDAAIASLGPQVGRLEKMLLLSEENSL